jgi:hypothetical protein
MLAPLVRKTRCGRIALTTGISKRPFSPILLCFHRAFGRSDRLAELSGRVGTLLFDQLGLSESDLTRRCSHPFGRHELRAPCEEGPGYWCSGMADVFDSDDGDSSRGLGQVLFLLGDERNLNVNEVSRLISEVSTVDEASALRATAQETTSARWRTIPTRDLASRSRELPARGSGRE